MSKAVSNLKSRLYEGKLFHSRNEHVDHRFIYPHASIYLSLDEIDEVCAVSRWVSQEKFNLLSFHREDFLPSDLSLQDEVSFQIKDKLGVDFDGDIFLLANWRSFGFCMNPLSLFYCLEEGEPKYVVAEVRNTPWNQRHVYVVNLSGDALLSDKAFHVSPFMPMDTRYHWTLPLPGDECRVGISVERNKKKIFSATMKLQSETLTGDSINGMLVRFPAIAVSVVFGIYIQAFKLWLKKVPLFRHPNSSIVASDATRR